MGIDWGDVPTWIAGAGGLTALVFARSAAISARRTSDVQTVQIEELRAENRRRDDLERRSQASRVSAYIGVARVEDASVPALRYINTSGLPVYELTFFCFTPRVLIERTYFVNGPSSQGITTRSLSRRLVEEFEGIDPGPAIGTGVLVVACSFRDATGNWWYRTASGELFEAGNRHDAGERARASGPTTHERVERIEDAFPVPEQPAPGTGG